jgi:hypothetical protein
MDASASHEIPPDFPRVAGGVYPLYHVLRDLCSFAGARVLRASASDPFAVAALSLENGSQRAVWVANLQPREREVRVEGFALGRYVTRTLDVTNAERAMSEPEAYRADGAYIDIKEGPTTLVLRAYGVTRIGTHPTG